MLSYQEMNINRKPNKIIDMSFFPARAFYFRATLYLLI